MNVVSPSTVNISRLKFDLSRQSPEKFESYWHNKGRAVLPSHLWDHPATWFEIGAGSGWLFTALAKLHPEKQLVALERSRMRGKRLIHRSKRTGLSNIHGFRANAIGTVIHEVPSESLERIYILYPCPWPRNSQRRNRWYLHPIMRHIFRVLKKGGLLIWASDQEFYINEAQYICLNHYDFSQLAHGPLSPNPFNHLDDFHGGRTKFEASFLTQGLPCYELIVTKR